MVSSGLEGQMSYTIKSDRQSVWVNHKEGNCLARLSFHFGEIFPTPHTRENLIPAEWHRWVRRVKEIHGIEVGEEYRPRWAC